MSKIRIAVLVSGSGSNLQAILDGIENGRIDAEVALVFSNRKDAFALKRANSKNIKTFYLNIKNFKSDEDYDKAIIQKLKEYSIDYVILAGYLRILTPLFIKTYRNKIINIHPSLLPKHGGKGYYGIRVHESVINSKDEYTGATVHFVDEGTDTGNIILQKKIKVDKDDNAETLQKKVLEIEHKIIVEAIDKLVRGEEFEKSFD